MYIRKEPFIIPLIRQATSTTSFTTKTQPWKSGDVVVIDTVSVAIDAHKPKTVHVGIIRDEFPMYLESLYLSANGQFFCTKSPIVIPSGYRVIIKCVSPTAGITYTMNIFGHIEEIVKE